MNHKISIFSLASLLLASSLTGCMYPGLEDDLAVEESGGENSSSKEKYLPSAEMTNCGVYKSGDYQVLNVKANITPNEAYEQEELGFCYATHDNPTIQDKVARTTREENPEIVKWTSIYDDIWNIDPGQTYYVRAFARNAAGTAYSSKSMSVETPDLYIKEPKLKITTTDNKTYKLTGSYSTYSSIIFHNTVMGFCYQIDGSSKIEYLTEDELSSSNYVGELSIGNELKEGHTYTFQLYFKSGEQYVYSNEASINLDEAHLGSKTDPAAPDATLTSIKAGTKRGYFTIAAQGSVKSSGYALESYGLCWSEKGLPTTNDYHWENTDMSSSASATINHWSEKNLEPNTTYHFRAFGTNGAGTGYSPEIVFTTPDDNAKPREDLSLSNYNSSFKITSYFDGTTYIQNECGVCYSATNKLPEVGGNDVTKVTTQYEESSSNYFSTVLQKGTDLIVGQTYYFRAYIKTSHGYVYSNAKKQTVN